MLSEAGANLGMVVSRKCDEACGNAVSFTSCKIAYLLELRRYPFSVESLFTASG